ncbi:cysteine ABC transporter permease [Alicyclobacillus contaminans]|uniref:amino acid ABC transporter permease n=1 Tax=Alicyclobacillus contaminans TaxID=392016 RepID=UPI0003FA0813|nr:amino acid ABC transporter permease [Alicyclobacillus contaminans]GMA51253.1 cysteine ABC transporter permease [Alicyclobacillus contaminans]
MSIDVSFILNAFVQLLFSVPTTLLITGVSVLCGFVIGMAIALVRIFSVPVLSSIAIWYVTFIRGTPMLVHLLLIYNGLPLLIDGLSHRLGWGFKSAAIPVIDFVCLSFSITASAYLSEVIRSGLLAIDRGQMEAALSIGMTKPQALRRVVLPQALAASIPNFSNTVIGMLHGSTLAFTVPVVEVMAKAQIVASTNWKFLESYLAAAVIFWGITVLIETSAGLLERRVNLYNRGGVA